MAYLELKKIEKSYKSYKLKVNSLEIKEGEFFALLGASGCGKTTLLKIIAGLTNVDKGEIYLKDKNITRVEAEKRELGMVFQQPLLFPHMTVEENVMFGLKMKKIPKKERVKRAREVLKSVDLEGFGERYPIELSGGQQQRVSLARAIVCKPKILLMDEPFSALDPGLREEMKRLISYIHKKYKITIIFVTHDRNEAFSLADRMAIMKDGMILQVGKPDELYKYPSNVYIARFLGGENIYYGTINEGVFISDNLELSLTNLKKELGEGYIFLPPESLEVRKINHNINEEVLEGNTNKLFGTIEECSFQQGFLNIKFKSDSKTFKAIQKESVGEKFILGEEISVNYEPKKICWIPN
ncbi:ABC transporter ATP-binding protein [Clostridium sp. ZS2-4]|uniref:ABC transporter ATP-binding protein n=1 Tax=Clostridium sp. ZS2-4 TaxID=2987703 RepID=UPI00227C89ED|nr:ABC transporter ATP-binding protein [Clostridium sp. ZS2-4]MCY6355768.1 ABC transporter ATP-binding protein [Clostridium sp. ZS2-4]